jgi:hypothetical protein
VRFKQISGIAVSSAGVVSVGWDDTLRLAPTGALLYSEAVALTGQPCAVAANVHSDLAAVATRYAMYVTSSNSSSASPAVHVCAHASTACYLSTLCVFL